MITTMFNDSTYKETSEEGVLKGDFETMRKDVLRFAKEKYFKGHSDV